MSAWKNSKIKAVGKTPQPKKGLTPLQKRSRGLPFYDMVLAPSSPEPIESIGMYIPLYDSRKRKQLSIKEQIADVTNRLHKTLCEYDTLNYYDEEVQKRESVVKNTKDKLQKMQQGEMKDTIEALMNQYDQDVSENTIGALNERDELLYQLADWFSADHSELEQLEVSMGKEEENELERSCQNTLANFEKLKRVQRQLTAGKLDTKKMLALQQEKKKLEQNMMNNVKDMKTIGIQAIPKPVSEEPPPWKNAADQIVTMLNQVRLEGSTELMHLSAHLQDLMKNLDKQQKQIKSLQTEVKRERKVTEQLSDENTDLNLAVRELREKVVQLKGDLGRANKALEKKLAEGKAVVRSEKDSVQQPVQLPEPSPTKTKIDRRNKVTLKGMIGDEVKRLQENVKDLQNTLKKETDQVANLQLENNDLKETIADLELQLKKKKAKSVENPPSPVQKVCPVCQEKAKSVSGAVDTKTDAKTDTKKDDEIRKLREKLKYFQKCLADTELRLSDAYKEISELRLMCSLEPEKQLSVPPPSPSTARKQSVEIGKELIETEEEQIEKKVKEQKRIIKKAPPKKRPLKLPPLPKGSLTGNMTMEKSLPEELDMPEATSAREEKLWKIGALQAKMSQLMKEIIEFINLLADMIFMDPTLTPPKDPRFSTVQESDFENIKNAKGDDLTIIKGRQKRTTAFFLGQKAIGCLKDAYELMSGSLSLQHEDYEFIYRAFKNHQYQRTVIQAILAGKLSFSALQAAKKGKTLSQKDYSLKLQGGKTQDGLWKAGSDTEGHKSALNNAVLVLGIHRSKSEVDVHSVHSEVSQTSSQHNIQREHSQIFLSSNVADVQRERRTAGLNREETKIPTTTVPKKGLIKLTALSYEVQDPFYYDRHKEEEDEEGWVRKKPLGHISDPHKPLVKKTMIEHMKEGNKMLAEEEKLHHEQEEIEKQLGEYTIGDLHKNLFDMTDLSKKKSEEIIKSVTTATVKNTTATAKNTPRKKPFPLSQRSVTLPSIKDFSFG